jgi:bifunctional oligoribonuclease and PAP phosphatase NrnA
MILLGEEMKGVWQMMNRPSVSVIVSHRNPDGDAIGSSLALYHSLKKLGHAVSIIFPSEYPALFQRFFEGHQVQIYDINTEAVRQRIASAEMIFALDFNALDRIDKLGELVSMNERAEIAMIDHHLDPEPFARWMVSDTTVSSTCELLFDVFAAGNFSQLMDVDISESLLLGILTDTGCFSYSTTPELFRKVATLIEYGVDYRLLVDEIFNSWDEKYVKLLGYCLNERLEFIDQVSAAFIYLTKEDFSTFNIQRGDTEGIVNYLLKIKKVKIAVLITEQPTIIKFSFRSKGDISVSDYARKFFKGGGHKNASGGSMFGTIEGAKEKVRETLLSTFRNH